jgi:lysophospholipase L1-like esterase
MKRPTTIAFILIYSAVIPAALRADRTAMPADPNTYLADLVKELQTPWPNNRTLTLVFHGHSVPAGYFKTPVVDTFNAYPHLLHRALKELYPNAVINVIVTAVGGESSDKGAERFDSDVLIHKPDVIFIDYGLNDRRIDMEEARNAWSIMITKAKRQGARVILLTPTGDLTADWLNPEDPLSRQAYQIRRLALFNEVGIADSYRQFANYVREGGKMEDLMSQVNHPNRKGHDLAAAELLKWFKCPRPAAREH